MNSNEIYVSLDIGTSNVKVIIGQMTNDSLNILGVGSAPSDGIRKGSIVDIDETVRSIKQAVENAERMVGLSVRSVIVGINGNHVQLQPCHGVVAVSSEDREIHDEDIARVIDAAQVVSIPPEREIIDVIPGQFVVDGLDGITDPRGMIGVRLEMEGTIITGSKTVLHNLLRCVEKAGLEIADICLQPLACGSMALSKDERNLGVALVNMGAGSTTISIFEEGNLKATSVLQIGGDHVTKDISIGLRTTTEEAERIKIKHGNAFVDLASEEEAFTVSTIGSSAEQEFNQYELAHIIEPRIEEMLELIEDEIKRMGIRELPGGFVLTGGMVGMDGVLELAREILQHNVRVAVPDYIGVREPQYTTGIGLIQFTYKNVKIQGKEVAASLNPEEEVKPKRRTKAEPQPGEKSSSPGMKEKVKNFFNLFVE
ncbi:cell division protein FtsA [Bacillus hwajinpoensis]|jgi:cell division protein FtsA|uniref:Cell division protein FtsA n=1 Tax=Guptibacillus hwajinpoensis TaxID=208199 RepID=A0A845EYU0_9BACL|nr:MULTISPECIES: cell division protein FtsA [Bacillaceae]MCA0174398.1 cell division protein FtsA [Bacillus sp. RAR_GA_16]MCA0990139.1 cell division protein FtsA [Pseudalkalibacillus hwajinpoensis]MYL63699.1 cell division protein FtsA [Pseudalkalibacillus hwajinpoensis]PFG12883.1 cell division protein FtsA [Bacillus sp. es.036]QHA91709.1 cell division protein FtsA [Bacillus sp. N1-1]